MKNIFFLFFFLPKILFSQTNIVKISPFNFFYGAKAEYEKSFTPQMSGALGLNYYNISPKENGLTFKTSFRYYFKEKESPASGFYVMPSIYFGPENYEFTYGSCGGGGFFSFGGSCRDSLMQIFIFGAGAEIGYQAHLLKNKRLILDTALGLKFIPVPSSVPRSYPIDNYTWPLNHSGYFPSLISFTGHDWNESLTGSPFTFSVSVGYMF